MNSALSEPEAGLLAEANRHYQSGDLSKALQTLDLAVRATEGRADFGRAVVLLAKATWLREAGDVEQSGSVLSTLEAVVNGLAPDVPRLLLAMLRAEQGIRAKLGAEFDSAARLLVEASELSRDAPGVLSSVLSNLGDVHLHCGRLNDARAQLERALELAEAAGDVSAVANRLKMLGLVYQQMHDMGRAREYWVASFLVASEAGLPKEVVETLTNMVMYDDALPAEERIEIVRAVRDWYERSGFDQELYAVLSALAGAQSRGGQYAEARRLFETLYVVDTQDGLRINAVYDLLNLVTAELNIGDLAAALVHAESAVSETECLGLLEIMWAAYHLLARVYLAKLATGDGGREMALDHLAHAEAAYERAADGIELIRLGAGGAEEREFLFSDKESFFEETVDLYQRLAQILDDERDEFLRAAFMMSERSRARAFLDVMGHERLGRIARGHPLARRRMEITEQLLDIKGRDPDRATGLLRELRALRSQIAAESPVAAMTPAQMPSFEEIVACIPADCALVEFLFAIQGEELFEFVLARDRIVALERVDLSGVDLAGAIHEFRAQINRVVFPTEVDLERDFPAGGELFDLLFAPIWDAIGPDIRRLALVPHRDLHTLPFPALWYADAGAYKWLGDRFDLTVLPSASSLPMSLSLPRPSFRYGRAVVLGNPKNDLDGAAIEATHVAELLGVEAVLGSDATRDALLNPSTDAAVVHVAAHGAYNPADPLISGVEMSNGRVTADDLLESSMSVALLTLSACVTGLAQRRPGDELIGLARAATFARIPSVITTLWPIYDASAPVFFEAFYSALLEGMPKDSAMRTARSAVRAADGFDAPLHWAPFVLMGDWN